MFASVALLTGVAIGAVILLLTRSPQPVAAPAATGTGAAASPTTLGWLTLALGAVGAVALAVAAAMSDATLLYLASILASFAAVVTGIGALVRHQRAWPTWVGLVAAGIPAVLWIVFAVGSIANPG
jgi:hypothetical protein